MSLDKLEYIIAVAEEQTLTRAAQKLYVSQPTLTNYINKLEESLGVKLFDRSVTPIQVTDAGRLYISKMKKIQRESDILVNELRYMAQKQTVFNIGIGSTRGNHWLPIIIPHFRNLHPNVVLQFHEQGEEDLEIGLQKGTIDIAIGVLNTGIPDISYSHVAKEPVFLAIPRSFDCVASLSPNDGTINNPYYIDSQLLKGVPFLLPYPGNGFYRSAQILLNQAEVNPLRVVSYKNMNTAYQLAALGVGAIFITATMFDRKYPECKEKLAFCTLQQQIHIRNCVAGYRDDNKNSGLIKDMITIIEDKLLPEIT